MGIASTLAALATIYTAIQGPPKQPGTSTPAPAQGGGGKPAESVFAVSTPGKSAKAPQAATPNNDAFIANLIGPLLSGGMQGGAMATAPAMAQPVMQPQASPVQPPPSKISQILGDVPEALAAAAPLLGLMNQDHRVSTQAIGAQGGGSGGQMVQGLNLPRRQSLSELLAALPRPRYG